MTITCVFKKAELVYWGFDYLLNEFISYYLVISLKEEYKLNCIIEAPQNSLRSD